QNVGIVPEVRRPGKLTVEVTRLAIAGEVNEVVMIDVDAVLARRPEAALVLTALVFEKTRVARASPGLQQVACLIELEHGGCRHAAAIKLTKGPPEAHRADRVALLV